MHPERNLTPAPSFHYKILLQSQVSSPHGPQTAQSLEQRICHPCKSTAPIYGVVKLPREGQTHTEYPLCCFSMAALRGSINLGSTHRQIDPSADGKEVAPPRERRPEGLSPLELRKRKSCPKQR